MQERLLSILIPTLPERIDSYCGLTKQLFHQRSLYGLDKQVQILSLSDTKEMTVGEKRNWLIDISCCKYVQFLDDDDKVADNYLPKMIEGTLSGMDVITFNGEYHENGNYHSDFIISTMVRTDVNQGRIMYRRPNHICAVLRDVAVQCKFPPQNYREDSHYSEQINKIIKNEFHINEKLYFYMFSKELSQTFPK